MHHGEATTGPASRERAATSWPDFDLERTSVRVVLLDPTDRLLLFRTVDPLMARIGTWWELPGGGMEPGETIIDTAVREVAEETGFGLAADQIEVETGGRARWRRNVTYLRRGVRTLQHEFVVVARIGAPAPDPDHAGRTPEELQDYVGHRWWSAAEVVAAGGSGSGSSRGGCRSCWPPSSPDT